MNSYLGHSNIIPSTPFIVSYHLSAAHPYLTRSRVHNYELPSINGSIDECNFIYRVLYKDCY